MKKLLLVKTCILLTSIVIAQNQNHIKKCSQHLKIIEYLENATPKERQQHIDSEQELETFTEQYIQNNPDLLLPGHNENRAILFTIPVVFHVLHEGASDNISDAQILDALSILNRDYQLLNADANNVVTDFAGLTADIEIEFKLAKKDNYGNCTSGITRTKSSASNSGDGATQVSVVQSAQGNWPGNKYLNIFIVQNAGSGAAGYTYKPTWTAGIGTTMRNGIVIQHNYVGSIGTSSVFRSRALTHEVGHWLNLDHTWGGTNDPALSGNCSSDDGVADTPETIGWTTCNLSGTTCDANLDNVENYMEYSYCSKMFTLGQKARMHAALASSVGGRINVVSSSNLIATGVNEPDQLCEVNFEANKTIVCEGSSVDFTDLSFFAISSWSWSFPGAIPASSTDQNPTVTYNTPGDYEVTLIASDGVNSDTKTKIAYIKVLPNTGIQPTIFEGFENITALPTNAWYADSPSDDWQITSSAGAASSKSFKLNNYGQDGGNVHTITSSTIDLSGTGPLLISFDYAYKEYQTSDSESLKVYGSNDCGDSWTQIKSYQGTLFGSGQQASAFVPSDDDWIKENIDNIPSNLMTSNFRLKFEFTSQGSNHFYIDNLFIGRTAVSIDENNLVNSNIVIYPNPSKGQFLISNMQESFDNITIIDLNGRIVKSIAVNNLNQKNINISDFEKGVYIIQCNGEYKTEVRKIIIQ